MKENEKKTSDQDVELNLEKDGDKIVGGVGENILDQIARAARAKLPYL